MHPLFNVKLGTFSRFMHGSTVTVTYWSRCSYGCSQDSLRLPKHINLFCIDVRSHDSLRLPKHIDLFSIGVHTIAYAYPNVKIITAAVDHEVNDKYHIIPGIGKLIGYFWQPRNPLLRNIFISWVCSQWLFINWWKYSPFPITFPVFSIYLKLKKALFFSW